ncbi:ABC transporter permease [Fretibacterium sp. OH1220_COT-178]|uniref:ABC transporter permease n=1 Tax=Fretibacterium sp. OH1220_COT-178 TaxID=2491047 RepID=UPI001315085A|nr:ABC transporter permease [Fretibacterium sp. OH1220_COT-178]
MKFRIFFSQYGTIMALATLAATFVVLIPGFSEPRNLLNILYQIALLAIISEGFTMCLIVGELDLAFPNVASLSGALAAGLIFGGMDPWAAVMTALATGVCFGVVAGILVTKIGIPSLITTLASGIIAGGMVYLYTKGVSFYGQMPESFLALGRGRIGPIPSLIAIMLIVVALFQLLISTTRIGRYMQATGANPVASRLAGINTDGYKILAFAFSGLAAAFTGVLLTAKLGSANPEGASGYMMDAFASALLGMTVLSMGRANPFGTFVGALMIGVVNNGMTLAGSPYYLQDITKGIIIIISVALTSLQNKRLSGA